MHCFSPSTWARERQRTLEAAGGAQDTATAESAGTFHKSSQNKVHKQRRTKMGWVKGK